eukprot:GEZU01016146.1.p1 GENE.GEZU01016146.1~~GEZU01016146.1.p1  ORF type:complete len:399 (-),score=79.68 GEZU01016146.1:598-1794(-)
MDGIGFCTSPNAIFGNNGSEHNFSIHAPRLNDAANSFLHLLQSSQSELGFNAQQNDYVDYGAQPLVTAVPTMAADGEATKPLSSGRKNCCPSSYGVGKKAATAATELPSLKEERNWVCQPLLNPSLAIDGANAKVLIKSRKEPAQLFVYDKLYSSIKYELHHSILAPSTVPFLLAKLQVIDPATHQEIRKGGDKPICQGNTEAAISKRPDSDPYSSLCTLEGVMKLQITDVSYHHDKRKFCFKVSYFNPDDLAQPVLVLLSAPFQVFARRTAIAAAQSPILVLASPSSSPVPAAGSKKRKASASIQAQTQVEEECGEKPSKLAATKLSCALAPSASSVQSSHVAAASSSSTAIAGSHLPQARALIDSLFSLIPKLTNEERARALKLAASTLVTKKHSQ